MQPATKVSLVVLIFAALLLARVEFLWRVEAAQTLPSFIGKAASVEGAVVTDPDVRDTGVRVNIAVSAINGKAGSGTLLVVLPKGTAVTYGDELVVQGSLQAPQSFMTDTGRVFDYPGYLRVQGVSALMQKAKLMSRAPGAWSLRGTLFSVKHAFERSVEKILPAQDAALLEGILLGERRGLPQALTTAFIIASLIHVVVLSGYNISIVAEATLRSLRFLPRTLGYALGIVLMILFVLMTGAGSTSLRACIMALIAIVARYLRRPAVAMRSLVCAAAVLVLFNPLVALYDPSFVLSILATFGLITLSPWVEAHLPKLLSRHGQVRSIAASTIAVQAYVLPALLYYTGIFSFVALPANILTLPFIPFAMLMGFVGGLLGFIHPLLGLVPALLSDLVLRWMMFVANTAAGLPLSHVVVPAFGAWLLALVYVPLTFVAFLAYANHSEAKVSA
jgi:competence protein ComEC